MSTTQLTSGRTHIILVPGFGGFDALGQIRYYAGLTPLFLAWHQGLPDSTQAVLHYFDNLPTAAVVTRAARLRDYVARRILRKEFQRGDKLALVGHSTGGLDIRRLLWELVENPEQRVRTDGLPEHDPHVVTHARILEMLERVVFLSVPQRGTNIANWVGKHELLRRLLLNGLRNAVTRHPTQPGFLRGRLTRFLATVGHADLFTAARDAIEESDEHQPLDGHSCLDTTRCPRETLCQEALGLRTAAREAYSELRLWTQHVSADFGAIQDLEYRDGHGQGSPAHFDASTRARELELWRRHGIATRSFATVGKCPFDPEALRAGRMLSLIDRRTWPAADADTSQRTDLSYRWSYRACVGGPFAAPDGQHLATEFGTTRQRKLESWENDGIVNTASMLWPDGAATRLVNGDHGDIIGHYKQVPSSSRSGRRYSAYDLLRSDSGFTDDDFKNVWSDVLDFCVGRES
jgi:hypothetical protein